MAQSPRIQRGRKSVFTEVGLTDNDADTLAPSVSPPSRPALRVRFRSQHDIIRYCHDNGDGDDVASFVPFMTNSRLYRLGVLAFILAMAIPLFHHPALLGGSRHALFGVSGGVIQSRPRGFEQDLHRRQEETRTDVCKRWSQQSTLSLRVGNTMDDAQGMRMQTEKRMA